MEPVRRQGRRSAPSPSASQPGCMASAAAARGPVHGLADLVAVPTTARRAHRRVHVRNLRGSVFGIDGPAPAGVAPATGGGDGVAVGPDGGTRAWVAGG